jgi:hypothetical protein
MNYRVDGWGRCNKKSPKCFLQQTGAKKEIVLLAKQTFPVFPLQRGNPRLYHRDLSWKVSKEALEIDIV